MDLNSQKLNEIENYIKNFKDFSIHNTDELKNQISKSFHENANCS